VNYCTEPLSIGIGYYTVKHLACRGATVYLAARNESKAIGAIAQLETEGLGPGFGQVNWLKFDLMDPRKAKAAAEEFLSKETRLDILGGCQVRCGGPSL
jgi:NAD(P)-dependent dehydrogenase (short-subunit alcohol dehydrogenase family)